MAEERYITSQLIDFTLSGPLAEISRGHVRSCIFEQDNGLSQGVFGGLNKVDNTGLHSNLWRREALLEDITSVTFTIGDNAVFKVPTDLITATGMSEEEITTALTTWLANVESTY